MPYRPGWSVITFTITQLPSARVRMHRISLIFAMVAPVSSPAGRAVRAQDAVPVGIRLGESEPGVQADGGSVAVHHLEVGVLGAVHHVLGPAHGHNSAGSLPAPYIIRQS